MGRTIGITLAGPPTGFSATDVKSFLETCTGEGTVTAVELHGFKFVVQFIDSSRAQEIIVKCKANELRKNDGSPVKAWEIPTDITPNRISGLEMDNITLDCGYQISKQTFAVLTEATGVSVEFESPMEKIHFYLIHNSNEYRLQLSRQNIRQIVLHPSDGTKKLLLIKLVGAPRIYEKLPSPDCFHVETRRYKWVRTTDFTQSLIGQSSALCLQIPPDMEVPDFKTLFPEVPNFKTQFKSYTVSETPLSLEPGSPFCVDMPLVPIVQNSFLPYKILFKVCYLVQTGCLPGVNLNTDFFNLVDPKKYNIKYIEDALEELHKLDECCYDPVPWLQEQYCKYQLCSEVPKRVSISLRDGLVYVHRVQVTPTRVHFSGPEVNMSNGVLRHYIDHIDNFIRVSFIDEEWNKLYAAELSRAGNERTELHARIISTLRNGIEIGDKKFEFLAFSRSQLQDNSLWMFAATDGLTADNIREWMGDFSSIRNVAKYASRLGQSFASSTKTFSVDKDKIEIIPDIEKVSDDGTKYIFSDGIGKISADFARSVAEKCGVGGSTPSAFQIRYGGFKGVVAVDPTSSKKLSLRDSMLKYKSKNTEVDVLSWSKYKPGFLNRQIITLLSTLGVSDAVFETKQREAVAHLEPEGVLKDTEKAQEALYMMSPGESVDILKEMLNCGYKPNEEPFLSMMLESYCSSAMVDFKVRARIFIPEARQMMGCLDETGNLNYGEVFVHLSQPTRSFNKESTVSDDNTSPHLKIITDNVVVAKNPCLHPGDVRILQAVDVPQLHHMVDCVVFPQKGQRPHPNECSGSDLDGDIYFVCWDKELIPPMRHPPMHYNPAAIPELDHDVKIEDLIDYFANSSLNNNIGVISNAHAVYADKEKALSKPCTDLAELFSIEVDSPKTGVHVVIPRHLHPKQFPDFMEKVDKETYVSDGILGKLFRQVKDILPQISKLSSFTKEVAKTSYDEALEVAGFNRYIPHAVAYKEKYDYKLRNLMEEFSIQTEAELLSIGILKMSEAFDRKINKEAIGEAVRVLREETKSLFFEDCSKKRVAWYHVTYHHSFWDVGMNKDHYISFPWCVYKKLANIKRKAHATRLR